jgi:hypothetical protein
MPRGLRHVALSIAFTDGETTGRFFRNEYSVAHLPARSAVPGFDLFPEPQPPQLQLRKLLSDFPPQAIFFGFAPSLATSRKHPQIVTSSSFQQYTPAFVATSFDDLAITLPHCLNAESSAQILFPSRAHRKATSCPADLSKRSVKSISSFWRSAGHFRYSPIN